MNGKKEAIAQRLNAGLYGQFRKDFRSAIRQIAKDYIDLYQNHGSVSQTNLKIAQNIIEHIDENIEEGAIALVDYLEKQDFQTTVPRSFSNMTASAGKEVTSLPDKITEELESFDYKQCAQYLETDKINNIRQMMSKGPNKVNVEELRGQIRELDIKVARLEGELKGKDSHIQDLKDVSTVVKKSNEDQQQRTLALQSEAQDTKRLLAAIAQQLGMGGAQNKSDVPADALYSDRGLLNDLEIRIVVKERLVSNPRLQLIRSLSEQYLNEASELVRKAIEVAVCQLISDTDRSMIGIIQAVESGAGVGTSVKLGLNVPDVFDSIAVDNKEKAIARVYKLINDDYKNPKLAAAIRSFIESSHTQRVEVEDPEEGSVSSLAK